MTIYQKTFMSGNSVAVRLPKSLGIDAGADIEIHQDEDGIHIRPRRRKIDVSGFAGKMPWLSPLTEEQRTFEDRPLDWEGSRLPDAG